MNSIKFSLKIKLIFISLLLFLSVFSNAYAQANCSYDPDGHCGNYNQFLAYNIALQSALTSVQDATASGKPIDWEGLSNLLGISYTSPDDTLDRLTKMYAETSAVIKDYKSYFEDNDGRNFLNITGEKKVLNAIDDQFQLAMDNAKEKINNIKIAPPAETPTMGDDNNGGGNGGDNNSGNDDNTGNLGNNNGSFFDVSYMLSQIEKQIPALIRLVMAIGYLSGFIMIVLAIMKLKAYGQQTVMSSQHAQLGPSLAYFVFGTILMFLPSMVEIATNSVMPASGDVAYEYAASSSSVGYAQLFSAIIAIIRLVGYIAFLRGWLILSKTGGHGAQPGNLGKGIIHVVGGILAINIITTWEVVRASFGFVW